MPTLIYNTGFEHGVPSATTSPAGKPLSTTATSAVASTLDSPRSGSYHLRCANSGGATSLWSYQHATTSQLHVGRFGFKWVSPTTLTARTCIFNQNASSGLGLFLNTSGQIEVVNMAAPTTVLATSSALTRGTYYRIDFRNNTSTSAHVYDVRIDGVSLYSGTGGGSATAFVNALNFGCSVAQTAAHIFCFDDVAMSRTTGDFPLGDGYGGVVRPSSLTLHTVGVFVQDATATAITTGDWARLDDADLTSTTDYIRQTTGSSDLTNGHPTVGFSNTATDAINGVRAILAYNAAGTQANTYRAWVRANSVDSYLHGSASTQPSIGVTALGYSSEQVANSGAAWTDAMLDGTVFRFGTGGGTDVNPIPATHAIILEVDYATTPGTSQTIGPDAVGITDGPPDTVQTAVRTLTAEPVSIVDGPPDTIQTLIRDPGTDPVGVLDVVSAGLIITATLTDRIGTGVRYADVILGDGPIGYWRLDETTGTVFRDSSGNGAHANRPVDHVPHLFTTGAGTRGEPGGAQVDTSTGPHPPDITDAASWEFWIEANPESTVTNYEGFVGRYGTGTMFGVQRLALDNHLYARVDTSAAVNQHTAAALIPALDGGKHHVVFTVDCATADIGVFMDGVHYGWVDFLPGDGLDLTANTVVAFSEEARADVALYDYALTPAQVAEHYATGVTMFQDDIVAVSTALRPTTDPVGLVDALSSQVQVTARAPAETVGLVDAATGTQAVMRGITDRIGGVYYESALALDPIGHWRLGEPSGAFEDSSGLLALDVGGGGLSVTDDAAFSVTNIDARVQVIVDDAPPPGVDTVLLANAYGGGGFWILLTPSDQIYLRVVNTGLGLDAAWAVANPVPHGTRVHYRVTRDAATGGVEFSYSYTGDPGDWTSFLQDGGPTGAPGVSAHPLYVGVAFSGAVITATLLDDIDGDPVFDVDFSNPAHGWDRGDTSGATGTDATGKAATITGVATVRSPYDLGGVVAARTTGLVTPDDGAVQFTNGADHYVTLPVDRLIVGRQNQETLGVSVAAWFQTDDYTLGRQTIVSVGDGGTWGFGLLVNGNPGPGGDGRVDFLQHGVRHVPTSEVVTDALRHHAVAIVDPSGIVVVLLDGVIVYNADPGGFGMGTTGLGFLIGRDIGLAATGSGFHGIVDEVSLYDHALTVEEARALYAAGVSTFTDSATASIGALRSQDDPVDLLDAAAPVSTAGREATDPVGILDDATRVQATLRDLGPDAVGLVDAAAQVSGAERPRTDTVGLVDDATRVQAVAPSVSDPVGLVDTAAGVQGHSRDQTEPEGLVDTAAQQTATARDASDPVGLVDAAAAAQGWTAAQADPVGLVDAATGVAASAREATDPVGLADDAAATSGAVREASDPVDLSDTTAALSVAARAATDPVDLTDATTRESTTARDAADLLAITDAAAQESTAERATTDPVGALDDAAGAQGAVRDQTDPVDLTDSFTTGAVSAQDATDVVGLVDDATGESAAERSTVDPVGLVDATAGVQAATRDPVDPVGLVDAASPAGGSERSTTDPVGLLDDTTGTSGTAATVTDPEGLTDTTSRASDAARASTDPVGLTDTAAAARVLVAATADLLGLLDTATPAVTVAPTVADLLGILDGLVAGDNPTRTISDTVGVLDTVTSDAAYLRAFSDLIGETDYTLSGSELGVVLVDLVGVLDPVWIVEATLGGLAVTVDLIITLRDRLLLLLEQSADATLQGARRDTITTVTSASGSVSLTLEPVDTATI